jgi:hypothetical protein
MRTQESRPPPPGEAPSAPSAPSIDELMPLFEQASNPRKASRLNTAIAELSRTEAPERLASALQGLLAHKDSRKVVDEQGVPVSVAATRALLSLPHPHPLEVAPEHLEALREHDRVVPPALSWALGLVLGLASLAQGACFMIADMLQGRFYDDLTADQLAGTVPPEPATVVEWGALYLQELWRGVRFATPWVQFVTAVFLFVYATVIADTARERIVMRRAFLVLGVLGFGMGFLLPRVHGYENLGTMAAGVGALVAGLLLRKPRASAPGKLPAP